MENPDTQDMDNISEDIFQDENIVQKLLCETEHLKQVVEDRDNDPREAINECRIRLNRLTLNCTTQMTLLRIMLDKYTKTLYTAQKKTSLEMLQDIPTLNGQDFKLEDWLMDIETAS